MWSATFPDVFPIIKKIVAILYLCSHRFCIGENFAIFNNQILCEQDYQNLLMTNDEPGYKQQQQQHRQGAVSLKSFYNLKTRRESFLTLFKN